MADGLTIPVACSLFATFVSAVAQVLLKKAAVDETLHGVHVYLNVRVVMAYAIFLCATILSVYTLRRLPLALSAVLDASSYLYATFFGIVVFGERMTRRKAGALMLILAGMLVFHLC